MMNNDTLQKYIDGALSQTEKAAVLNPQVEDSSELLFSCHPADYAASTVARAVEDCDARLPTSARRPTLPSASGPGREPKN